MDLYRIYEELPQDLFYAILKYVEPVSPGTIALRQNKRNAINKKIKSALSRNNIRNNEDELLDFVDVYELWAFGFTNDLEENLQLQGVNCIECGNYIISNKPIHNRIKCNCYDEHL